MDNTVDDLARRINALNKIPSLNALNDAQLGSMSTDDIAHLRNNMFTDQASQNRLAPFEHRAYARETAAKHPMLAPLLTLANPAYQASKVATNGWGSRTGASLEQLLQGFIGTGEGIDASIRNYLNR